jgi:P27 family predicted phage terminase small subunit
MANRGPKIRTAANTARVAGVVSVRSVAPEYLSERARAEYSRLVDDLDGAGKLAGTDPRVIELAAMNYDLGRSAYDQIQADGCTVESDRGNLAEHPAVKTLNAATIRYKAIMVELGLTPASRKAAAAGQAASDPLAIWRARVAGKGS